MQRIIFIVAEGHEGDWEAFSLDFDLAVQGRTFDELKSRMEEAIQAYIESAMKEPEPARTRLLRRRAPLLMRIKWTWRFLVALLSGRSRGGSSATGFPLPCPA